MGEGTPSGERETIREGAPAATVGCDEPEAVEKGERDIGELPPESQASVELLNAAVAPATGEVSRWYGALNGVKAQFFFDTGASRCFISRRAVQRMGLRPTKAESLSVKHSSGKVEVTQSMVRGARLELHVGWATLLDMYVLDQFPDVDVIVGTDFMHDRNTHLKLLPDASTAVELTVGRRRIELCPGPNAVYEGALPARVQRLHKLSEVGPEDEVYLCFARTREDGGADLTAMGAVRAPTKATGEESGEPDWRATFLRRLDGMRCEQEVPLTEAQRQSWQATLDEFKTVFEEPDYANAAAPKLVELLGVHRIPLYEGAELPRNERRGNYSDEKVQAMMEQVHALLAKGFVEPSESPLGAPVLLVRKPDGSWRFTVDYRSINHITRDDAYMPPRPDTLYPQMKGAKVFARVDARDGFWGIPMADEDKWKTAFQTPIGLYHWTVMPMGLKGSPARFQRFMDDLLRPLSSWCVVFVDDIVVWADSVEQLHGRLRRLLGLLQQHSVKLKMSKCAFFLSAVRFLGHIVDGEGMTPDRDKVKVLADMPAPVTIGDVRSLMGVVGFLRGYVPHIVEHLAPIQALLKKGTKITWTPDHQECKDRIVDALVSSPVLALPDAAREKAIMTDASDYAMGAVLLQRHEKTDGTGHENSISSQGWRPVAFMSKALTPEQARQAPTTREFFAMAEAVSKWDNELANQSQVTVFSDHRPLEALGAGGKLNRMIMRRMDDLSSLDMRVVYKPAAEVGLADWLSRRPDHRRAQGGERETSHPWLQANLTLLSTADDPTLWDALRDAQERCPKVQGILGRDRTSDEWRQSWRVHKGLLWSTHLDTMRVVVPADEQTRPLREAIIAEMHDTPTAGHLGPQKTAERVARHFVWRGLFQEVKGYCQACNVCQRTKPAAHALHGRRRPLPIPHRFGAWMSLDFVSMKVKSSSVQGGQELDAVLVVVDKLSKRAWFIPTTSHVTAEETARLYFDRVYREVGWPLRLVSDRDPKFTARVWRELWQLTGTTLNMSTADHAETDGQSEGMIRTLTQMLRAFAQDMRGDWAQWLPALEFAYNDSWVRTTGMTPFLMERGQHPITPLAMELGEIPTAWTLRKMQGAIKKARQKLIEVTTREAEAENARRKDPDIVAGQYVYLKREKGTRGKLDDVWEGPYEVTAVPVPNVVEVRLPGRRHARINVEHVKLHVQQSSQTASLGKDIERHRIFVAGDAVQELQFRVNGRWVSLLDLVQNHGRWGDVHLYCEEHPIQSEHSLGQLVRRRYGRHGYFLGRVAFFDPDDGGYQVVFNDKEADVFTAEEVRRYAYSLAKPGASPGRQELATLGERPDVDKGEGPDDPTGEPTWPPEVPSSPPPSPPPEEDDWDSEEGSPRDEPPFGPLARYLPPHPQRAFEGDVDIAALMPPLVQHMLEQARDDWDLRTVVALSMASREVHKCTRDLAQPFGEWHRRGTLLGAGPDVQLGSTCIWNSTARDEDRLSPPSAAWQSTRQISDTWAESLSRALAARPIPGSIAEMPATQQLGREPWRISVHHTTMARSIFGRSDPWQGRVDAGVGGPAQVFTGLMHGVTALSLRRVLLSESQCHILAHAWVWGCRVKQLDLASTGLNDTRFTLMLHQWSVAADSTGRTVHFERLDLSYNDVGLEPLTCSYNAGRHAPPLQREFSPVWVSGLTMWNGWMPLGGRFGLIPFLQSCTRARWRPGRTDLTMPLQGLDFSLRPDRKWRVPVEQLDNGLLDAFREHHIVNGSSRWGLDISPGP